MKRRLACAVVAVPAIAAASPAPRSAIRTDPTAIAVPNDQAPCGPGRACAVAAIDTRIIAVQVLRDRAQLRANAAVRLTAPTE